MRVLVAEDNPVIQNLLRSLLTKWNYEVVLARSGAEAWDLLQNDASTRLAILDWMMPGLDRSEEHTSELQSLTHLVCRLLLEKNIYTTQYFQVLHALSRAPKRLNYKSCH